MGYAGHPDIWTDTVPEFLGGLPTNANIIPSHPESTTEFSPVVEEDREIVAEMEATLNTDEPAYAEYLEDNNFVSDYVGTYEVEGEGGENVLLSPVRINATDAIALHYNEGTDGEEGTWENVDNVTVRDGYVYGNLTSFSPVAVFAVKRDIYQSAPLYAGRDAIVCNGNRTVIYKDEDSNKYYALNEASGTKIEVGASMMIFGGTVDGTPIEKTDLIFKNVTRTNLSVIAGSFSKDVQTTLKQANVTLYNTKIASITGSTLKVRTEEVNITLNDSTILSFMGSGESQNAAVSKCVNAEFKDNLSMACPYATRTVNMTINNSTVPFFYVGGNCGYTYTENANLVVNGLLGTTNWLLACSSNGSCKNVTAKIDGVVKAKIFGVTNRGYIGTVKSSIKNSNILSLCVTGEMADDVNGTVDSVSLDIDSTVIGKLDLGRNGGHTLTAEEAKTIVNYVKYSRDSKIEISNEVATVLGGKLIKK